MFEHRFKNNMSQPIKPWPVTTVHPAPQSVFLCLPQGENAAFLLWIYQMAYEKAEREVLAERRARRLEGSVN